MEGLLPLSSLRLLVPPLRLISAAMWKVVHLRNIEHYGKVEEFLSVVTEAIPDILTDTQTRLLTLGFRAKMIIQMLKSQSSDDLRSVKAQLDCLLQRSSRQVHPGNDGVEVIFVKLVQRLLNDPKQREYFLKNVYPVEYGHDFDIALETLVCKLFHKLDDLLLVPNFKQAAAGISDTSSVLEEYMHCVTKADDLEVLLQSKAHLCDLTHVDSGVLSPSEQRLLASLSLSDSLTAKDIETRYCDQRDIDFQNASLPSVKVSHTQNSSSAEEADGKCADSTPEVPFEEPDNQVTAAPQTPSTSDRSSVTSSSMIGPQRQRIAHKCSHCGKCYIYRYELLEHQRLHTGEIPYKCSQCGKAFRRTSDLSTHRQTQCAKAAYVCIKCERSFQSLQEKFSHQCVPSIQKFNCSKCGKSFKKMYLLVKHELTHNQSRIFTCRQCKTVFSSMSELRSHQKIHPPELSNRCQQCGKLFSSVACVTAHELRHQQQRTQICVRCGKAFKNKHDLNLHIRSHTGERPFQCTHCGKRFSVSGNLNIHMRTHTGEKPYLCSECGKTFTSAGELQIHCRTHTGEKPYKCSVCGRGFTMASKVTFHMRVHTGERPYVCSECGKGFSRGSELKKHTLNHTGVRPYACQMCAKTYTCLNHLKRHLKTHSAVQTQTL